VTRGRTTAWDSLRAAFFDAMHADSVSVSRLDTLLKPTLARSSVALKLVSESRVLAGCPQLCSAFGPVRGAACPRSNALRASRAVSSPFK